MPLAPKRWVDELGARYVVEGNVRRAGNRVRIIAKLMDATSALHVWSDSYERDLSPGNVFDIPSEIARQIAIALQVELLDWAGQRPSVHPTAWDLYARGRFLERRATAADTQEEARRLPERAIELDPGFAPAHASLALVCGGQFQYSPRRDAALLDRAETCARRSLELDPQDPSGRFSLAAVLVLQRKHTEAIRESKRAIELNPSADSAYALLGRTLMSLGRLGEARRLFDSVRQINPRFPGAFFWAARGTLHYLEGDIEGAVPLWERARTMGSGIRPERIMMVRYYEIAGRREDAQAIAQEMLSAQPEMTAKLGVEALARHWNEEWIPEDLQEQLRNAGLPRRQVSGGPPRQPPLAASASEPEIAPRRETQTGPRAGVDPCPRRPRVVCFQWLTSALGPGGWGCANGIAPTAGGAGRR